MPPPTPIDRRGVRLRSLACAALAGGMAAFAADASLAQSFTGTGPVRAFTVPDPSAPPPPAGAGPRAPAAEPASTVVTPTAVAPTRLRFLPAHADGLMLAGEVAERTWVVTLTAAEASDPAAIFQIAYEAAASVSPETSTLTLAINDHAVGTTPIRPPGGARLARFPIPLGTLVRGANLVRIAVGQRHRVDCSPEATFELWTRLKPRGTGLLTAARAGVDALPDLADVAAVPPAADGATPLNIRLGGQRLTERGTERALAAAQTLALLGRYDHVVVAFDAQDGEARYGIDLALGPVAALATAVDLAAFGTIEGPRLVLLPASQARRAMLVITGRDDGEVDGALALLTEALRTTRPAGAAAALQALADRGGRAVEGGERIALRDLGAGETAFSGRGFRLAVDIRLPHDILAADYGRMIVDLTGGYAAGLDPGAQLRVEVNGGEAASVPLGNPAGDRFQHQEILLPLSRLRPGRNSVAITAALPMPSDRTCLDDTGQERTRFTLSERTEIAVPAFARVARSPELSHFATGGFPFAQPEQRPVLQVPSPDRDTMGAAATIAVRLASAAGHPIPFAFMAGRPPVGVPVLVVAAAPNLDPGLLVRVGIDPQSLRAAWQERAAGPAATTRRGPDRVAEDACGVPSGRSRTVVATAPAASGSIWSVLDRIAAAIGWGTARAGEATGSRDDLSETSLIVAQAAATAREQAGSVTVVSAATPAALRDGVACLTESRVWERLAGRLSLVDGGTGEVRTIAADHPAYIETQPRTVGNLRRIAAGWLSLNPELYAVLALLVATCLAASTHWLVGNVGRRSS